MKSIITLYMVLFSVSAIAQDNFKAESNNIIWQQVYDSNLSEDEIKAQLRSNAILSEVAGNLTGTSMPEKISCAETTPIYMRDALQYFTQIEVKEGRYRVTLSNFQFTPSVVVSFYNVETSNAPVAIEDYMLNNSGEMRTGRMHTNSRDCLNRYFQDFFSFSKVNNDW